MSMSSCQVDFEGMCRVDIFGVREEGTIEGKLVAPIRPEIPSLVAGNTYLLEAVIRTLRLDITYTGYGRLERIVVGDHCQERRSNHWDQWWTRRKGSGRFVGSLCEQLCSGSTWKSDRKKKRQDIFVALYDHQLPPGAGQVAHYRLEVPSDVDQPVEVTVKLNYRKFDKGYIDFMNKSFKEGDREFRNRKDVENGTNDLPITVIARIELSFLFKSKTARLLRRIKNRTILRRMFGSVGTITESDCC